MPTSTYALPLFITLPVVVHSFLSSPTFSCHLLSPFCHPEPDLQCSPRATNLKWKHLLDLSSRPKRSEAEGPAVLRTLRGNVFPTERTQISYLTALARDAYVVLLKENHMPL